MSDTSLRTHENRLSTRCEVTYAVPDREGRRQRTRQPEMESHSRIEKRNQTRYMERVSVLAGTLFHAEGEQNDKTEFGSDFERTGNRKNLP